MDEKYPETEYDLEKAKDNLKRAEATAKGENSEPSDKAVPELASDTD